MSEKKITLTLDTCCFDKASDPILTTLQRLRQEGLIDMWHEQWTRTEMGSWIQPNNEVLRKRDIYSSCKNDACFIPEDIWNDPKKEVEYMEQHMGFSLEEEHAVTSKILKILSPEGLSGKKLLNQYGDIKILAYHILRKRMFFVSKDDVFFKLDNDTKIESEFPGVKIRKLNAELIRELEDIGKKEGTTTVPSLHSKTPVPQ